MNRLIISLILLFTMPLSVSAGMKERHPGAAGSQMSATHSTQMMSREMMHDMSKMMQKMTTMTRDMNRLMEKTDTMDRTRAREMADVMEQLSKAMHNISQHMAKGEMDKKMLEEMEMHMDQISNMIKTMDQKK